MPSLKSRSQSPPNGFQFTEAQTGWGENVKWWDFEQLCRELRDHRLGNPRFGLTTDLDSIRIEVDQVNALRCLSIRNADIYVNGESPPPKLIAPQRAAVGAVTSGSQTLGAWLGKGGVPVIQELANKRAETCSICPKNGRGDWTRYFTIPTAAIFKKEIERRHKMKLATPFDDKLVVCEACNCPLKLKVHTPLADILEHMKPEVMADLDPNCWILHER